MAVASRHGSQRMWHEQTQTHKQAFLSLIWKFLPDIYSSGYTEATNTSFSSIFQSWTINHLLKQRNNNMIYCLLKRAPVMSPALSKKLRNFKLGSTQSNRSKKLECVEKTCWALRFFFAWPPAAGDALSSLRTIEKRRWRSEKTLFGHWL